MAYYHYHVARCPHCGNESTQQGCRLDNCRFAQTFREPQPNNIYTTQEECWHCGRTFWVDYGTRSNVNKTR